MQSDERRGLSGQRLALLSIATALLLFCLGCGGAHVTIEGAATFDGQPIESGSIVFEPADGKGASTGGKIADGRYSVNSEEGISVNSEEGIARGKKIVRITGVRKTGRQIEAGPPAPPGTMVDEIQKYIPASYNTQSTLTCEIAAGSNEVDFHLQPEETKR